MTKIFYLEKAGPGAYELRLVSRPEYRVGEVCMDQDGFFKLYLDGLKGYMTQEVLSELSDHLGKLNDPYDDEIKEYFERLKKFEEIADRYGLAGGKRRSAQVSAEYLDDLL